MNKREAAKELLKIAKKLISNTEDLVLNLESVKLKLLKDAYHKISDGMIGLADLSDDIDNLSITNEIKKLTKSFDKFEDKTEIGEKLK